MNRFIKPIIFIPIVIIFIIIFSHYSNLLQPLENVTLSIFKPAQQTLYSWSNKLFNTEERKTISQLSTENNKLNEQSNQLLIENNKLKTKIKEYKKINKQFEYIKEKNYNALPVRILGKSTDQTSQTLLINQGAQQGIIEGLPVIIEDGILIGKVEKVEKNTSTIILITDNFCQFTARVQQQSTTSGITTGQHGLSLNLELIPKTEEISNGQLIVTAGLEENIPADLLIGTVEKINNPPGELWQTAIINPLADFRQLDIVSILLPQISYE